MLRAFGAAAAVAIFVTSISASAQGTDRLSAEDLKWREMIPDVVYFAPAYGDWGKGAHGKYARVQPGATVPMHTHSRAYDAVLLSGRLTNLLDSSSTRVDLGPGDYWHMAGGRAHGHVCTSSEPCLVYTHSDAAWDLSLVEQAPAE